MNSQQVGIWKRHRVASIILSKGDASRFHAQLIVINTALEDMHAIGVRLLSTSLATRSWRSFIAGLTSRVGSNPNRKSLNGRYLASMMASSALLILAVFVY